MPYIANSGCLSHHGIPGMKWGEKNGPPYPIRDGGHSAAEVKADPKLAKQALNNDSGKRKKERLKDLSDNEIRKRIERRKLEDEYLKSQGKMTRQQWSEIRAAAAKNAADLLVKDVPKEAINIAKSLIGLKWFFGEKLALTIFESKAGKSAVDLGKSITDGIIASNARKSKLAEAAADKLKGKKDKPDDKSEDKKDEDS